MRILKKSHFKLKKSKQTTLKTKLFLIAVILWAVVLMPYLYYLQNEERKFHEKNGFFLVKGVCTYNRRTFHGRYIHYKFQLNDTLYHGGDKVIGLGWDNRLKPGDSTFIEVSFIDTEYNFLE